MLSKCQEVLSLVSSVKGGDCETFHLGIFVYVFSHCLPYHPVRNRKFLLTCTVWPEMSRKFKEVLQIFFEHLPCARCPEAGNEALQRQKCLPSGSSQFFFSFKFPVSLFL